MSHARETSLTLFFIHCAFHNFDTLRHISVLFGRDEEEDHMQERHMQLPLSS